MSLLLLNTTTHLPSPFWSAAKYSDCCVRRERCRRKRVFWTWTTTEPSRCQKFSLRLRATVFCFPFGLAADAGSVFTTVGVLYDGVTEMGCDAEGGCARRARLVGLRCQVSIVVQSTEHSLMHFALGGLGQGTEMHGNKYMHHVPINSR